MKYLFILLSMIFLAYFFTEFEFRDAMIATLVSGVLMHLVNDRVKYYFRMKKYAEMYENIYVVSCHPRDQSKHSEQEVDLEGLNELIVCVPYSDVMKEIQVQAALLRESKNQHFNDPELTDNERLQIVPIIFRDAEAINETWKQFKKRVKQEIEEDRAERHAILKNTDSDWYHKYANYQRGISWNRK